MCYEVNENKQFIVSHLIPKVMARKKTPKKKLEIVFDPQKRKEFLTGFRKRKNERRKRAKDELERNLLNERKRIKQEIKDGIKHMKKTFAPLKELTEADKRNEDEYEDDDVKVKIIELSTADLAAQQNMLGENKVQASDDSEDEEETADKNYEANINSANCIPGMDFEVSSKTKRPANDTGEEENYDQQARKRPRINKKELDLRTKKELDHFKKIKTMRKLKQTKAFRAKEQLAKKANQKKARKDKNNTLKSLPKHIRKKKKFEKNRYNKGRLLNRKQLRKKNSSQ